MNTRRPPCLRDLRGKIVLLCFWTSGCVDCRHHTQSLQQVRRAWSNELVILGVHSGKFLAQKSTSNLRHAVMKADILHPVVNDLEFQVGKLYNVRSCPAVALIDPAGMLVQLDHGSADAERYLGITREMVEDFDRLGALDRKPLRFQPEELEAPHHVLKYPARVLVGPDGFLYIADTGHHRIIEARLDDTGLEAEVVKIYGSGSASLQDGEHQRAGFSGPRGLALRQRRLYVADTENHAIRAVDLDVGVVRTLAGTGELASVPAVGRSARRTPLRFPSDVAVHQEFLFIAMEGFHQLWVLFDDRVGPFAGNGRPALRDGDFVEASFSQPRGLAAGDGVLYVADADASAVREVTLGETARVRTLVGKGLDQFGDADGSASGALLQHPGGLAFQNGVLYIADGFNHKLKSLHLATGEVRTIAGTGQPGHADGPRGQLYEPEGLAADGTRLYVADTNNHCIRVFDLEKGELATLRLTRIERLDPTPYRERSGIPLGRVSVAPGPVTLHLELRLPESCEICPEVALSLRIDWGDTRRVDRFHPGSGVELKLELREPGLLGLEFPVYYHPQGNRGDCLVHHAHVSLPVAIDPAAGSRIDVPYLVPAPA